MKEKRENAYRENAYKEIKECMETVIQKYYDKSAKLAKNIYFRNGNDGNKFDWDMNDRTSEFWVFYDTKDGMGFCKLYYTKDNKIKGYTWKNKGNGKGIEVEFATKLNSKKVSQALTQYHDEWGTGRCDCVVAYIEIEEEN